MSALARLLLSKPAESLDLVLSYLPRLRWSGKTLLDNRLLWAILEYHQVNHRLPDAAALRYWLGASTDDVIVRRRVVALDQLAEVEAAEGELIGDLEMLISDCIAEARREWFKFAAEKATKIADGNLSKDDYRIKEQFGVGPDAAAAYFREQLLKDEGTSQKRDLEGDIHTNISSLSIALDEALDKPHSGRLFTGFRHIDDAVLIGPNHRKYIGVLGFLGSGKSTFTRSMIYNFATQGANVLYVPREESARTEMEQLLWIHADAIGMGRELPSLHDWRSRPENVTEQQRRAKDEVFRDFEERISIPGSIEVISASTMADVIAHYDAHKRRKAYNVLCIDYLAHLAVTTKDERQGHTNDFARFQTLSQDEGIVCITPLQANRKGFEEADEAEGDEWGVFRSANAVEYYSAATQGMDLVLGCWYRGHLKEQNKVRVSAIKVRGGADVPTRDLHLDSITRRVRDSGPVRAENISDLTGRYKDCEYAEYSPN